MRIKKHHHQKGFTLIELMVVISIISFIASSTLYSFNLSRARGRDIMRVESLRMFRDALEMYHIDNGKYPNNAGGSGYWGFNYKYTQADGSCPGSTPTINFDNSASTGFLDALYPDYINEDEWYDPFNPELGSPYNCRYIIKRSERDADDVQHHMLHCKLEASPELEKSDGGTNDDLYEIIGGEPWLCVTDIP